MRNCFCSSYCMMGRGSTVKTVRWVLRPLFQMIVDDDVLHKNFFAFEQTTAIINDGVMREGIIKDQCGSSWNLFMMIMFISGIMRKFIFCFTQECCFLNFVDPRSKTLIWRNGVSILTISFRELGIKLFIEAIQTTAGTKKLPMSADVFWCF